MRVATAVAGSRALVTASALVFSSSLALSIAGFIFQAIATRHLDPAEYGVFYSLVSMASLVALPVSVLAPVVARYSAEFCALHDDAHIKGLIGLIVPAFAVCGVLYVFLGIVLAVPVADFFHFAFWQVPLVALMAAITVLSTAMRAIGQGIQAYGAFAWSTGGEGVAKVVALGIAVFAGMKLAGTIGAFVIGLCVGAILIATPLIARYRAVAPVPIHLDWPRIWASIAGAASLTIATTVIGFADVLVVKHFFSAHEAGLYAVASLAGKILLYFVGFVPAVLIPQATHRHARGERTRSVLWLAVVFIGVVSVVGVAAYAAFGSLLLHILSGGAYEGALPLLPIYAAAMAALALTNSLGSYGISTHRLGFAIPLLLSMTATVVATALVHPTLRVVATEVMLGAIVMLLCVAVPLAIQSRTASPA